MSLAHRWSSSFTRWGQLLYLVGTNFYYSHTRLWLTYPRLQLASEPFIRGTIFDLESLQPLPDKIIHKESQFSELKDCFSQIWRICLVILISGASEFLQLQDLPFALTLPRSSSMEFRNTFTSKDPTDQQLQSRFKTQLLQGLFVIVPAPASVRSGVVLQPGHCSFYQSNHLSSL